MQRRSRVVRVGVLVFLALVAACERELDLPVGTLVVSVLRDSPPVKAPGAQVTIVVTTATATTAADGKATLLVPAGTHAILVELIDYCPVTTSATVATGTTTNLTVSLGTTPCVTTGTDRITTGGSEPLFGLVDIRTSGAVSCENDRLVEGTSGTADLMTNALPLTGPSQVCHGAAWLFTEYHAPWFDNNAATFPWTNASADVVVANLPPYWLRVPVTFWLSDAAMDKAAYLAVLTGLDLPNANDFLRKARSGLRLTNSEIADAAPDIIDVGSLSDGNTNQPPYPIIGSGCRNTSSIVASSLVYRPAHINIYVVDMIDGDGVALGRNCIEHGAPNVIFLKKDANHVALLHELGHALALIQPHWGHSDMIAKMLPGNVMASGATTATHMTLGQVARMHADTRSWLNQVTGAGTVRSRQMGPGLVTACSCPGTAATDDCPMVHADIARPGVPIAGNANPACHITTDVTCLSLPPGGSGVINANGWTDASATTAGTGDGTVSSLLPNVAGAFKPPVGGEGPGFVKASVTAGSSAGVTSVLISIGGTFTTVPVKVGAPCP